MKAHPEVEYVQLQLNYLDWEDEAIQAKACYEIATRYGKPVIVMEPIKGGALVNIPEKAAEILKRVLETRSLEICSRITIVHIERISSFSYFPCI